MLLKICKCLGHLDSLVLFGYGSKPWHTLVQKSEKDRCSSTNVAIALSAGKNMRKPWSLFVVFLILLRLYSKFLETHGPIHNPTYTAKLMHKHAPTQCPSEPKRLLSGFGWDEVGKNPCNCDLFGADLGPIARLQKGGAERNHKPGHF